MRGGGASSASLERVDLQVAVLVGMRGTGLEAGGKVRQTAHC